MSEMTAPLSPDREWSIGKEDVTWGGWFLAFYAVVVLIQGIHVVEHIIQLVQVYLLGVPDERKPIEELRVNRERFLDPVLVAPTPRLLREVVDVVVIHLDKLASRVADRREGICIRGYE